MATSPKKPVTRYGTVHSPQAVMGKEDRFQEQKSKFASEVSYNLPDCKMTQSVVFGSTTRPSQTSNPNKFTTGPGSYDSSRIDFSSEHPAPKANKFGVAARQSMALKTPSPGAVYDIQNTYWNGPDKKLGIGFNCDSRASLVPPVGSNAEMVMIKSKSGPAITMGSRFKPKKFVLSTPGAIYDVHDKVNFKTGPAFSFGKGRGERFKEVGYLPELDD